MDEMEKLAKEMDSLIAEECSAIPSVMPNGWRLNSDSHKYRYLELPRIISNFANLSTEGYWDNSTPCPRCHLPRTYTMFGKYPNPYNLSWVNYCPSCHLVWSDWPACCPGCGQVLELTSDDIKEVIAEGQIVCDYCYDKWDVANVKSANETGDIGIEEQLK